MKFVSCKKEMNYVISLYSNVINSSLPSHLAQKSFEVTALWVMYSQIDHLLPIIGYTRNQTKLHFLLPTSFAERALEKKKKKVPSFNHHFAVGSQIILIVSTLLQLRAFFHCLPSCEAMLWYCSRKPNQCPPGDLALKIIPGGCNAKFP